MTCREVIDFLMQYVDGELPAAMREEFDRHMRACPSCVAYLDSYKRTVSMAKESMCEGAGGAAPPAVPKGLVAAILEARKKG